jgi:hypothetical protein
VIPPLIASLVRIPPSGWFTVEKVAGIFSHRKEEADAIFCEPEMVPVSVLRRSRHSSFAALGLVSTVCGDIFFCGVYKKLCWGYVSHFFLSLLKKWDMYFRSL